jgi:hypothetical protein
VRAPRLLHSTLVRTRGLIPPFLVRLLAVVLAVAGAGVVAGRAPHALRVWTDPAAEVASAGRQPRRQRSAHDSVARAAVQPAPVAIAPAGPPAALPLARATHPWPCASDLRQLLALKQSRLI